MIPSGLSSISRRRLPIDDEKAETLPLLGLLQRGEEEVRGLVVALLEVVERPQLSPEGN